jgi:hypothetical protein
MKISVQQFAGVAPSVPPRYLKDSQAQVAENADVRGYSLKSLKGLSSSYFTLTKAGTIESLYRFGQDVATANRPTQYWFHWAEDVDVCRGQISGDTSEWTYYTTESGAPKATYSTIALGAGTNYPSVSRDLGLPAPGTGPTAVSDGAAADGAEETTAVYAYTWVATEAGLTVESAPSPASGNVTINNNTTVTLNGFESVPTGGYSITHKRIYRSVDGTYLFVKEIAVATASTTDTAAPDYLAEELPSLYWAEPPDDLRGLTNLPNGTMAGFVGRDVYFCDPYRPYAWPEPYRQALDYPVVGLGAIDTTLVVLTTGVPYLIQGSHPDSVVVVRSEVEQACVSKRSVVSMGGGVVYASPDGLVLITTGGAKVLTQSLYEREDWQALNPESMHAYGHDNKYVAFYDTGSEQGSIVYDFTIGQFTTSALYATAGYQDLQDDRLYLVNGSKQVVSWDDGAELSYTWRSKKFSMPRTTSFALAQVYAESYDDLTFKLYVNGVLAHTQTVTGLRHFRLPATPGDLFEFQLEGTDEVFAVNIAQSAEELAEV